MVNTSNLFSGTTHRIKRHLAKLPNGSIFPTRLFLPHGYRAAVDRCLARLVTQGRIVRVTRGVFMKTIPEQNLPLPSIEEVARIKARAFGREIFVHGATAAIRCGFHLKPDPLLSGSRDQSFWADQPERMRLQFIHLKRIEPDEDYIAASIPPQTESAEGIEQIIQRVFAVVGKTTSFMYGKTRIVLKGTAQRYLKLGDTIPGLFLRGLLYMGKRKNCWLNMLSSPILLGRPHKQTLRVSAWQMPAWLSDQFFTDRWNREVLINNCLT